MNAKTETKAGSWSADIYDALKSYDVKQVPYVPDGGHAELIEMVHADRDMRPVSLTTEEEGIAVSCGAWLGGQRSAMLMQSSGVGNCINMLSLVKACRLPFLTLVTMRGEWGEFNPWQVPMGSKIQQSFEMMDVHVLRASRADEVGETVRAAARMVYEGGTPVAVLLSQRLIGAKVFVK
ncbi:phosphonopyruvate decarboxylase [Brucella pseudogrignonensis]|uniref:thiamine pyrophosphate-binding protein n=1 Tax=Brucella pseudogrignonensis TaxID=419475 RepID=UPI0007DA58B6|nr:thiamine pyrophosphate-binding protein [Brucella pseudogrignonensis]ANG98719.1 phosphonopyruvate decarboxylase [Brucella pseudogrignonensis]